MEKNKKNSRTGKITLEEAKFAFNSYYNTLHANKKKHIRQRAKKSDMQWIKEKKMLYPNKKGSIKYLSEKGPRTFDFWGVDAFPKDTITSVIGEDNLSIVSKGVGPKTKSGKSYSEISKENYKKRYGNSEKALVHNFWNGKNKGKRKNKKMKWIMDKKDNISSDNSDEKNKKIEIFEFKFKLSDKNEIYFRVLGIYNTFDLLLLEFDKEKNDYKDPIAKIINGQKLLDDHSLIDDWNIKFFKSNIKPSIKKNTKNITDTFKKAVTNPKISLNYGMVELEPDELKELVGGNKNDSDKNNVVIIDENTDLNLSDEIENTSLSSNDNSINSDNSNKTNSDISDNSDNSDISDISDNHVSNISFKKKDSKNILNKRVDELKTFDSSTNCDDYSLSNLTNFSNFSKCSNLYKQADEIYVFQKGNKVKFADADFNNMLPEEKNKFFEISKKIFNLEDIGTVIKQHGGKKDNFKKITNQILNLIKN